MTTEINWTDFIGETTLASGGHVGDLLRLAGEHIDKVVNSHRLTQAQAGTIYANMIPAAFSTALQFTLDKPLREADLRSKEEQLRLLQQELGLKSALQPSQISKSEADVTLITKRIEEITDSIRLKELDRIDREAKSAKEQALLDTREQELQFKVDVLLPLEKQKEEAQSDLLMKQVEKLGLDIDLEVFRTELSTWLSAFNSGKVDNIPEAITNPEMTKAYNAVVSYLNLKD